MAKEDAAMNDLEKLSVLKILSDMQHANEQEEDTLSAYLSLAEQEILRRAYPYDVEEAEIPAVYEMLQIKIALYLWSKRGAEGQTSHSENGISRGYGSADIPEEMLSQIVPKVGVL